MRNVFLVLMILVCACRSKDLNDKFHITGKDGVSFLMGSEPVPFNQIVSQKNEAHLIFFEFSNCDYCIGLAMETAMTLLEEGEEVYVVAVCDYQEKVSKWAMHYSGLEIFRLSKHDFYKHFTVAYLPTMVTFSKAKINDIHFFSFSKK